jgi:hypothetical protein
MTVVTTAAWPACLRSQAGLVERLGATFCLRGGDAEATGPEGAGDAVAPCAGALGVRGWGGAGVGVEATAGDGLGLEAATAAVAAAAVMAAAGAAGAAGDEAAAASGTSSEGVTRPARAAAADPAAGTRRRRTPGSATSESPSSSATNAGIITDGGRELETAGTRLRFAAGVMTTLGL